MVEEDNKDLTEQGNDQEKPFLSVIVHSFFIVPFLIAVFCVLLFGSMHLLTRENRSAFDYLEDIKVGGATKRWQGAFELSKFLSNPKMVPQDERFCSEMINVFRQSVGDDPRVRQYLALAMGRTGNKIYYDVLTENIDREQKETLPAIIYALGMLKDKRSLKVLYPFLDSEEARLRSLAVAALGNLENEGSINKLRPMLDDIEPNVAWGAAISLAKLGDSKAEQVLLKLLDRSYYENFDEVDQNEELNLILMAIESSKRIKSRKLNRVIKKLAENDPNMHVRSKALAY